MEVMEKKKKKKTQLTQEKLNAEGNKYKLINGRNEKKKRNRKKK